MPVFPSPNGIWPVWPGVCLGVSTTSPVKIVESEQKNCRPAPSAGLGSVRPSGVATWIEPLPSCVHPACPGLGTGSKQVTEFTSPCTACQMEVAVPPAPIPTELLVAGCDRAGVVLTPAALLRDQPGSIIALLRL